MHVPWGVHRENAGYAYVEIYIAGIGTLGVFGFYDNKNFLAWLKLQSYCVDHEGVV